MTKKTVRVRKGTMAGCGGGTGVEQGKGYACLSFCPLEAQFRQDQDITILYRFGMGFMGKLFYRVTKKTVRVRTGTMAGGGGGAGFEQGKGYTCLSFCRL